MKHLLIIFCFLVSVPAFGYDYSYGNDYNAGYRAAEERRNFERNEIRMHRDRGETKDYGGYWAKPTPQPEYDSYRNDSEANRRYRNRY